MREETIPSDLPSFNFSHKKELTSKGVLEQFKALVRVDLPATGEEIHSSIAVFRPGVDGEMRFGDDNHTAHPVRAEVMKDLPHDGSPGYPCRLNHHLSEIRRIVQEMPSAVVVFHQQLSPQCLLDQCASSL